MLKRIKECIFITTEHAEHAAILLIAIYLFRVGDTYKTIECNFTTAEDAEDAEKNKTKKQYFTTPKKRGKLRTLRTRRKTNKN